MTTVDPRTGEKGARGVRQPARPDADTPARCGGRSPDNARVPAVVVVATKGRPRETATLLDYLARQTQRADRIVVVGASHADIAGMEDHPLVAAGVAQLATSGRAGLCIQRNVGLRLLREPGHLAPDTNDGFVAFFDDDFRPADDWLENAAGAFEAMGDVVGITGRVLADGVKGPGLTEADAVAFLSGRRPPQKTAFASDVVRPVGSLYGCNMAFRARVFAHLRFDEGLPLYGWQEDRDFTGQARALGRVLLVPSCRGVHLGIKQGRTSGKRFGYSQIANPVYLMSKGTMSRSMAYRFLWRALAANIGKSLLRHANHDHYGRLRGNFHAIADLAVGKCAPERIHDL